MITNADIDISNKGFANRDFYEIFQELVDIFPTVTTAWDPNLTNNSDPVFVLVEELALVANRLFYYIDKSALEQYPTSATQEDSFRRITELLGFNMDYYKSATSQVSFTYKGGNDRLDQELGIGDYDTSSSGTGVITLKAFDTTFKTDDDIVYTLLEDISLTADELSSDSKMAIQGEIKPLTIDGSSVSITDATLLQLYDLDEDNRVYLNDTMVAENGVFINKKYYGVDNLDDTAWRRVDNLLTNDRNTRVYKFGFDSSKNKPYIQFPEWIGNIIGNGLQIYYVITNGEYGQASNNTLTQLNSWSITDGDGVAISDVGSFDTSTYSIANGSSIGGEEKDNLDDAYISFKREVGTYNTFVSPQDYSDGITEYKNDTTNKNLVSALQVTDPERDPNKIIKIWARESGSTTAQVDEILDKTINPIEIYPHGTLPVNSDEVTTLSKFNASFSLLGQDNIRDIDSYTYDNRVVYHTFRKVPDDDIDIILEKATLRVNIGTTSLVNEVEQSSIISNVKKALYRDYNARNLEFGEEIPYESLYNTILNADPLINLVTFDYPTLTPYIVTGDGAETLYNPNLYSSQGEITNAEHYHDIEIVVNNIVAGRIPLYGINSSFSYRYDLDYSDFVRADEVAYIKGTTEVDLPANTEITLASNHVIQTISDSYLTTTTYPAYVYYSFKSDIHDSKDTAIPKNSIYRLEQGEILYIYYTDSEDEKKFVEYKEGDIIKVSFNLYDTTNSGVGENSEASRWANALFTELVSEDEGAISLYALGYDDDETIELVERNETKLNNSKQSCFWYVLPTVVENEDGTTTITNEEGSLIFKRVGNTSKFIHILESGEFFIYPNKNKTSLCVLSTGTRLEIEPTNIQDDDTEYKFDKENINEYIDTSELETAIASADVGRFEDSFMWEELNFKYTPLYIIETVMTTFVEDEEVTSNTALSLTNEWQTLEGGVNLVGTLDGSKDSVTTSDITNAMIRVIYRINGSAYGEQIVEENDYCHPMVSYATLSDKLEDSSTIFTPHTIEVGKAFQVYDTIDSYGDIILRTSQFEQEGETLQIVTGEYDYYYSLIHYDLLEDTTYSSGTQGIIFTTILNEQLKPNSRDEYTFNFTDLFGSILDSDKKATIECNQDDLYISVFDSFTKQTHLFKADENGNIVLDLSYIDAEESEYNLYQAYISVPLQLAINPYLEDAITEDGILDEIIRRVEEHSNYDYLGTLNSTKLINSYDPVYSFFDSNNLYNIFTLEKIDFDSSEFTIVGSSRKVS